MALNIDDSKKMFAEYVTYMKAFAERLKSYGYKIQVYDNIELAATYDCYINNTLVARLDWNIPYFLDFESFVLQKERSFSIDNVKNFDDWREFVGDVEKSLIDLAKE